MMTDEARTFSAFAGARLIAAGSIEEVLRRAKRFSDRSSSQPRQETILVFEDETGTQVDFDLHGTLADVLGRVPGHPLFTTEPAPPAGPKGRGRPKLGVVCREVCLLPEHWDWLEEQPGGPSVVLRRLVHAETRRFPGKQRARKVRDAVGRIMTALAGDSPNFEEASRALWAKQSARFEELVREWPDDVRDYLVQRVRESARLEESGGQQ